MPVPALSIAKYIVVNSTSRERRISNLKLQKILYYVQGWSLGLYEMAAFSDSIQAWVHGPVVPTVFFHYRDFKWNPISDNSPVPELPTKLIDHIDSVLYAYEDLTAAQLERLSHEEAPWKLTRGQLPPTESSTLVISHDLMKAFFSELANESDEEEHSAARTSAG